jgi:hypothetical protein
MGDNVSIDNDVTDFMNFKIKLTLSFRCAHKGMVCVRVFIWVSVCMCMSIYVYTIFLKKIKQEREYTLYYLMVEGSLTKIYNTYMFIYENIQHISVFTRIPNINDDPVTDNTSSTTGTSATA